MTTNLLYGKDLISVRDLSLEQITQILSLAKQLKDKPVNNILDKKIVLNCFFEPSTRTQMSFATAAWRLGGNVIGFGSESSLSTEKGESFQDSLRVMQNYGDLIVIRHPKEGAARLAADITSVPVINAGDGANQHPSQALIDLFTIQEHQHKLDGLAIALVGDLKYGRTIHSFAQACMFFNIRLFLVSTQMLALPNAITNMLKQAGVRFSFHTSLEEIIPKVDVIYMTRIQYERFNQTEYQINNPFTLTVNILKKARDNLCILHPLPRLKEIDSSVDDTPYAVYFQQAANGVFVRQALLSLLLNEKIYA